MDRTLSSAMALMLALGGASGAASAQTVQFRIVQESATDSSVQTTQPFVPPSVLVQNYAVQARVMGGAGLAGFNFDIVLPGEADANGTLARLRIQNSNVTYYTGAPTTSASGGSHVGMAYPYFYAAGINPSFNGLINTSGSTFSNTASQQEIGLITGLLASTLVFVPPGMDPANEGNPVTWSGYGVGAVAANGQTAAIPAAVGPVYFAQGQYVDVYRFRYTVSNTSNRTISIGLANVGAQTFTLFQVAGGLWGPQSTVVPAGSITVSTLTTPLGPLGMCCASGTCVFEPLVSCASAVVWTLGGTCAPDPCAPTGACCDIGGVCTVVAASACPVPYRWALGAACTATHCLTTGSCCHGGMCTVNTSGNCAGSWVPGPCAAGSCTLGRCCQFTTCHVTTGPACALFTWTAYEACTVGVCAAPPLGVCCVFYPACVVLNSASCTGSWSGWATCLASLPPDDQCVPTNLLLGVCCNLSGMCMFVDPNACTGDWNPVPGAVSCPTANCPAPTGACCAGSICVVTKLSTCNSMGGELVGVNLACNASGGYPCCRVDFNHVNGVTVQDIFDFLGAWFAGDSRTDYNGTAGLGVQDIFDYLNAWFVGC